MAWSWRSIISFLILILLASFGVSSARYYGGVTRGSAQYDRGGDGQFASRVLSSSSSRTELSVDDFGAQGNGIDDTNAFNSAWKAACSATGSVVLRVPKRNYLVKPVNFAGPCKAHKISVRISGTIDATTNRSDYTERSWLSFENINRLTVEGGGIVNGNGNTWWKDTCKIKKSSPCTTGLLPTALVFHACNNLRVRHLHVKDSMQMQVAFQYCRNVTASNLRVTADARSPNTDGIHITHTHGISISDSFIATGDDCISIVSGSRTVRATNITCGPGHGISIGSLGSNNSEAHVSDITVDGAKLSGTTNGLRIKTWQGGSGNVTGVKFMNVEMDNVKNPILIDQNYCVQRNPCPKQSSAVQVSDVLYRNITGTSASDVAIKFDCSDNFQCEKIVLQDVYIRSYGSQSKDPEASCQNVDLTDIGIVTPPCPNSGTKGDTSPPPPPTPRRDTPAPPPPPPSPHDDPSHRPIRRLSVVDFGAKGNGADDTDAFNRAWEAACSSTRSVVLTVPDTHYLVKPVNFDGPCKAQKISVRILGTLDASTHQSDYSTKRWLSFDSVDNLIVEGGGTLDGHGNGWWSQSCKRHRSSPCKEAPTALTFHGCNNLRVRHLRVKDSMQMQVAFERCRNVTASDLHITADGHSPNTDGIHITHTKGISISNSFIATGDDCISIVGGSHTVRANNITCGPGHGISIGSLGADNAEAHVSDVIVDGASLSHTTNGLRIKTWQGGSGNVTNVRFMNVEMHNVQNPIIIDQNYCVQRNACPRQSSAVQVSDVLYRNITGTSATDVAINFDCSESYPCQNIRLQDVNIQRYGSQSGNIDASCQNVQLTDIGVVAPACNAGSSSPPRSHHGHHHHHGQE